MSVDDAGLLHIHTELFQDLVADLLIFIEFVIGILMLLVRLFFLDKVTLEGGHLVLPEKRGIAAGPGIPHQIHAQLFFFQIVVLVESLSGPGFQEITE